MKKTIVKYGNVIGTVGAILLFAGLVLQFIHRTEAPYVYSFGALLFALVQFLSAYEGTNVTLRRLYRQQQLGALVLLLTGGLMFLSGHYYAGIYFRNEWIVGLAIAAVFELYTAFRIPQEEQKEN